MKSRIRVPSLGHIPIKVFGGAGVARLPILDTFQGQSSELLVEHFLMKSTFRVSTPTWPNVLLASVLSKAGWPLSITWKVRLHVVLSLLALRVT